MDKKFWLIMIGLWLSTFSAYASKVVTIGPSASSIAVALGEKSIVGADSESIEFIGNKQSRNSELMENVGKVKDIGYMRALTIEGIVSLQPNLVIADAAASPISVIKRLSNFNIEVISLKEVKGLSDVKANITMVAKALAKQTEARLLIEEMDQKLQSAIKIIDQYKPKKVLVLLQIAASNVYMLGTDTQSNRWLSLIGAQNILSFKGMRPASKEGLMILKPDVVIVAQAINNMPLPYAEILEYLHKQNQTKITTIHAASLDNFGASFGDTVLQLAKKVYEA